MVWFAANQQPEVTVAAGTMLWFCTGVIQLKIGTSFTTKFSSI
jgi:hypothetical protein